MAADTLRVGVPQSEIGGHFRMGNAIEPCGNCDGSGRVLTEEQWVTCTDCGGNGVLVGGETRQERHERSQKEAAEALRDAGKRTRAAAKPKATADA